ncbi:hypothetical protein VF14_11525 [Nostoc linckia z18]|uniref:Uncharacterized protein n=2 Tax=Nostoc linckia TaxID=92942 RepID=A0A9Q5ZA02_NOSLI|nr:hypothetical protein [Nostoc linckia]PHK40915.1 hypothetical protein VF12_08725 [Nostoc linckia z15]PHK46458.1 hypothetical protein VF13_10960 [Nostoc linckia z16]PHJ60258.1 hypothetical protein VF02_23115 [Nostoc linckia z1]PHJ63824.1 hypothetical protein VF05_24080 [Nostoc linckia z3]PHJ70838.1 hypothetical protein VF03_21650 [Nostoc linckia z2]
MKVRVKQDCGKSCPGDHITRYYKRGQVIRMDFEASHYPGKPYTKGTLGWMSEREKQGTEDPVHQRWAFWSNSDIDFALIFGPEDIDTLYLSVSERNQLPPETINSATFEIVVE